MIGIYKIENKVNGKIYIGKSVDIEKRWGEHVRDLSRSTHHNHKLQEDWRVYGDNSFDFDVIFKFGVGDIGFDIYRAECSLYVLEDYYMQKYNSLSKGYNIERTVLKIINGEGSVFNNIKPNKTTVSIIKRIYGMLERNRYNINDVANFAYNKRKNDNIFNNVIGIITNNIYNFNIDEYTPLSSFCNDVGISSAVMNDIKAKLDINTKIDLVENIKHCGSGVYLRKYFPKTEGVEPYNQIVISNDAKEIILNIIIDDGTDRMIKKDIRLQQANK